MKIAMIGCGAAGSCFAGYLRKGGADITKTAWSSLFTPTPTTIWTGSRPPIPPTTSASWTS